RAAAELTPDPDSPPAWRRRVIWLERLDAVGEFDQVRRLSDKWALHAPVELRGRVTALRAECEANLETASSLWAGAFADLAGSDPARAARAAIKWAVRSFMAGGQVQAA